MRLLNGRYELRDKIGEGITGQVYFSTDIQDAKFVAIKFGGQRISAGLHSIHNERSVLSELRSDYVIKLLDSGYDYDLGFYIVTDYLTMGFDHFRNITVAQAIEMGSQLAYGLDEISSVGYTHGDFHQDNFLIDNNGTCKIIDLAAAFLEEERDELVQKNAWNYDGAALIESIAYILQEKGVQSKEVDDFIKQLDERSGDCVADVSHYFDCLAKEYDTSPNILVGMAWQ